MLSHSAKDTANIISEFSACDGLPFRQAFSSDHLTAVMAKHKIDFRDRIMPPDVTLLAFCSQLISKDRSCKNAVTRINYEREARGLSNCCQSTSAYCQARSRLSLLLLKDLAKETAQY